MMGPVMGQNYHKLCFRCCTCNRLLDFKTYRTNLNDLADKRVYCATHNPKNGKYSETIVVYNRPRSKSPGSFDVISFLKYFFFFFPIKSFF